MSAGNTAIVSITLDVPVIPDTQRPLPGPLTVMRIPPQLRPRPRSFRVNCWSCGRFVWTLPDLSYSCRSCDAGRGPDRDPHLRRLVRAGQLAAHQDEYKIEGWIDHGDPRQYSPSPA